MFIEMTDTLATTDHCFRQGRIYEVDMATAEVWVHAQLARYTDTPPDHVKQFHERLDKGAGQPCLFLPHLGEFGHKVMTGIRLAHWHRASEKVVCCTPSERVLYPSAKEFFHDWSEPQGIDSERAGSMRSPSSWWKQITARFPGHVPIDQGGLSRTQELLCLRPGERIPFKPMLRGLPPVDVLLGVRWRDFHHSKNYPREHWQRVADAIARTGATIAVAGARPTTFDLVGQQYHTGDYDTDATIEAMQRCRLYLGTDSGAAHLAATVGCRMAVIREHWFGRDFIPRMQEVNPCHVARIQGHWHEPEQIARIALELIAGGNF